MSELEKEESSFMTFCIDNHFLIMLSVSASTKRAQSLYKLLRYIIMNVSSKGSCSSVEIIKHRVTNGELGLPPTR